MSTLTVTNIKATGETASRAVSGVAAAWVSLNMQTATVNDSSNVSSATDNGTGDFSMNYSNNMGNTNYTHVSGCSHGTGTTSVVFTLEGTDNIADASVYQTSLFRMNCVYVNSAANRTDYDIKRASVAIHGDLA
jgi:hypothetical protein